MITLDQIAITHTVDPDSNILTILFLRISNLVVWNDVWSGLVWVYVKELTFYLLISWRVTVGLADVGPAAPFGFVEHAVHVAFSCDGLVEVEHLMSFLFVVEFELGVCENHQYFADEYDEYDWNEGLYDVLRVGELHIFNFHLLN